MGVSHCRDVSVGAHDDGDDEDDSDDDDGGDDGHTIFMDQLAGFHIVNSVKGMGSE